MSISNVPKTGLLPNLLSTLSSHSSLAQEFSDADALHEALEHLACCRNEIERMSDIVLEGNLAEAMKLGTGLQDMVDNTPGALAAAGVMTDMKASAFLNIGQA